jgi:hypothetical protein
MRRTMSGWLTAIGRQMGRAGGSRGQAGRARRPSRRPGVEGLEGRLCLSDFTVIASGLDSPRGLLLRPGGTIDVAEGGTGGTTSTVGLTQQVPPPVGPYTNGPTAKVERITRDGMRTTLAAGLPSSQLAAPISDVSGVAALAVLRGQTYALITGGGASRGNLQVPNGVVRINRDGTTTQIADLSAYVHANPVANPEPDDFEPDGDWFSMIAARGALYALDANRGELVRIDLNGQVSRVVDISASQGHIVPTSLAYANGTFYVGNLGVSDPGEHQGQEKIFRVTPRGRISTTVATGLTSILGLAFDRRNRLYALESYTGSDFPSPEARGTGDVVRIGRGGTRQVVATGLTFPTALGFGPDGRLYVSNFGYGFGPDGHAGQIVRIDVSAASRARAAGVRSGSA